MQTEETKIKKECFFFKKGNCKKGESCKYNHNLDFSNDKEQTS